MKPSDLPPKWSAKIVVLPNGCWLWTGHRDRYGYCHVKQNKRHKKAHRFVYELLIGPIPAGLVIDHLCQVRCCVNPRHMEPVTNSENTSRSIRRGRPRTRTDGRCAHGHLLDEINAYVAFDADGEPLYAGVTCNPTWRRNYHRQNAPWWREAVSFRLYGPYLRIDALRRERELIWTLGLVYNQPPHNLRIADWQLQSA